MKARSRYNYGPLSGSREAVVDDLAKVGIDLSEVADVLERQGIASFVQSWEDLIKSVEEQLENAGADVKPDGAVTPPAQSGGASAAPAAAAPAETAGGARPHDPRQAIHAKAIELGKLALRATTSAGSGHPTTALSLAHLIAVLMYRVMRWDPIHPDAAVRIGWFFRGSCRIRLSTQPVPISG